MLCRLEARTVKNTVIGKTAVVSVLFSLETPSIKRSFARTASTDKIKNGEKNKITDAYGTMPAYVVRKRVLKQKTKIRRATFVARRIRDLFAFIKLFRQ